MKLLLVMSVFALLLSGCITEVNVIATPNEQQANATAIVQQTLNAFYGAQFTATIAIQQTIDTGNAIQSTVQAQQLQETLLAQAALSTATAQAVSTQAALAGLQTSQALVQTANALQLQAQQQRIDLERREMINRIMGWTIFLLIAGFLALAGWAAWQFIRAEAIRRSSTASQPKPMVIWDRNGRSIVVHPNRSFWPVQVINNRYEQNGVPAGQEQTVMTSNVIEPEATVRNIPNTEYPSAYPTAIAPLPVVSAPPLAQIPANAPWRLVADDWQGGYLPLGMGSEGLIALNLEQDPHLMLAGSPGSGKTHFCLRPLIAAALADGMQVVIFDRSGDGYEAFQEHVNARLVLIGQNNPVDLVNYLRRLNNEVQYRLQEMRSSQVEDPDNFQPVKWTERLGPQVLVVIEDLEVLSREMDSFLDRDDLWRFLRLIAADGHKVGIHLAIVFQDPLLSDFDLRLRRFFSPVCFKVRDAGVSRLILNREGPENFCARQFVAILGGGLYYGFGFAPEETELFNFLNAHPRSPLPAPEWLMDNDDRLAE